MEHRQLGGSGLKVPVLTLGTGTFGGSDEFFRGFGGIGQAEVDRQGGVALDAGLTMFDSADVYSAGLAEELLGKALRARRDQALISTKATFRHGDGPNDVGSSRWHLVRAVEDRHLRVEHQEKPRDLVRAARDFDGASGRADEAVAALEKSHARDPTAVRLAEA